MKAASRVVIVVLSVTVIVLLFGPRNVAHAVASQVDRVFVTNWPSVQPVSGSVNVGNLPATQTVHVNNFPAAQGVTGTVGIDPGHNTVTLANPPTSLSGFQTESDSVQVAVCPADGLSTYVFQAPVAGHLLLRHISFLQPCQHRRGSEDDGQRPNRHS